MVKSSKKKIGLALGTGAARGVAHIGVIKVLEKAGIKIDFIAGTSVGAVIGGGYAVTGNILDIEKRALQTSWRFLLSMIDFLPSFSGFVNDNRVEKFIKKSIGNAKFSDSKIPLAIVAADVVTGERIIFKDGEVAKAIRASMSIPVLFKPAQYDGRIYVDGGIVDPIPVGLAKSMGSDIVIAVNLFSDISDYHFNGHVADGVCEVDNVDDVMKGSHMKIKCRPSIIATAMQAFAVMERRLAVPELKKADFIISPDVSDIRATDYPKAKDCIRRGEIAAEKALPAILNHLQNNLAFSKSICHNPAPDKVSANQ